MIILTSITGKKFCLNSNLIYKIEEAPDTIITLIDGKTIRVKNGLEDIVKRVVEYNREIYANVLEVLK